MSAVMTRGAVKAVFGLAALLGFSADVSIAFAAAPDWSGLYHVVGECGVCGKDLPGYTAINKNLDPVVTAHLQPWAKARMEATDTRADDTGAVCQLAGIFRHPSTIAGFQWLQKPGAFMMVSIATQHVGVRRIYMTDQHPRNLPPTWNGHSIGHWEGDTLIVDTIGFNDKSWLMSGMQPHTEELHVVERIRQVADGAALEITTTVDDRHALTGPYTFSRYYRKVDQEFSETLANGTSLICNGEPGEQQRWNAHRQAARASQRAQPTPAGQQDQPFKN